MTKYDQQIKQDKIKWVLREKHQRNCFYRSKNDMFASEKRVGLLTDKEYIRMTT